MVKKMITSEQSFVSYFKIHRVSTVSAAVDLSWASNYSDTPRPKEIITEALFEISQDISLLVL